MKEDKIQDFSDPEVPPRSLIGRHPSFCNRHVEGSRQ